jgi:nitroreductase
MNDNLPELQFIPLEFQRLSIEQQREKADELLKNLNRRRTVRDFSAESVPIELIEKAIITAGTAPSGANLQPWRFVVVQDFEIKKKIREAAEREE